MSVAVLYMSMSLDGYIAGPNDNPSNPGGDGFGRLHDWFDLVDTKHAKPYPEVRKLVDEYKATGAVLTGRNTVEQVDHYRGNHHDVRIFVLSH